MRVREDFASPLIPIIEPGRGDPAQNAFLAAVLPLNLFKSMAGAPGIAALAAQFGHHILFETDLDPKAREIAILRVANLVGNAYEIGHHERIGRDVGLSELQIAAARTGDMTVFSEAETIAAQWAEQVAAGHKVSPDLASRAVSALGAKVAIELSLTVGYYLMIALYLDAFRIPFEGAHFKDGVQINADRQT